MLGKFFTTIVAVLLIAIGIFYFAISSSYQMSIEAKVYYYMEKYKKANEYAIKAYNQNNYNKMAFTVMTQSQIALQYQDYVKRGEGYFQKIETISSKKNITTSDKNRIKFMCGIMIGEYENLSSTIMTDANLAKNAKITYKKFKEIEKKLF